MSYQAATTHHKTLISMPQTHHQKSHIAAPINPQNDSDDDDVVFLESVPKVEHTPEEYDPECTCSTCQVVKKLLAECTCEDCKGTGQEGHSTENVIISTEMPPPNAQPSKSSIQINDASTSEHISENDRSRSSTMDDDSIVEEEELNQEIESEDDDFSRPSTSKSLKRAKKTTRSTKQSKVYVGKRKLAHSKDSLPESSLRSARFKVNHTVCPLCERKLPTEPHLKVHLRSHKKCGYRCTWSGCAFFYTRIQCAKKHVCADHLQVETASAQQINQHLVRVNPMTDETGEVRIRNNQRVSPVTKIYPASDEERNSSEFESDDNDKDNLDCGKAACSSTNQANRLNCPKCEVSFIKRSNLFRHYRCVHLQLKPYYCKWPECSYTAAIRDHVVSHANSNHFNSDNRKQAKNYVAMRKLASPNDPILESLLKSGRVANSIDQKKCAQHLVKANPKIGKKLKKGQVACPQCRRIVAKIHLKNHLRTHKTSGFRCNWSGCGFFYSTLPAAKKHVCGDHLQVEAASTQQINRHLVKVNPKTGKTESVKHSVRQSHQTFNKNCPKCGRNIQIAAQFVNHIRTHMKSGYRCTWAQCGFFYSQLEIAKQHILKEHLKGKLVNSTHIQNHLVRVDHRTGRTNRVQFQSKKKK